MPDRDLHDSDETRERTHADDVGGDPRQQRRVQVEACSTAANDSYAVNFSAPITRLLERPRRPLETSNPALEPASPAV